jgi:release factor glutamine methyltransferase
LLLDPSSYRGGVTVLEVIQRSTEFLTRKGVESPRLQAEWLLAHVLRLPRLQLYLNFARGLTDGEVEAVRQLVKRRGQREPLQQLLGTASFCGLELKVNRHVLVPRPETEALAEQAWQFLAKQEATAPAVLDFGTGSGCLAITLAMKCPRARLHALDVSADALAIARENAAAHGVAERITFCLGDGFAALAPEQTFELMVANPPYVPTAEIAALMPEVRDHDPCVALDGGPDGLEFYRRLAATAGGWLRVDGRMMLEFGDGQEERLRDLFSLHKWVVERVEADYTQRPRILVVGLPHERRAAGAG